MLALFFWYKFGSWSSRKSIQCWLGLCELFIHKLDCKMTKLVIVSAILLVATAAVVSGAKYSDGVCREKLRQAGIPVWSSGNCRDRNAGLRCTSLDQIQQNTCNCIIVLKRSSGCPITVTGGTEKGHASGTYSHYNGYKLDISLNSCINNYITRNFPYIGKRPADGALQYKSRSGNIYARESNHWDITYFKC